GNGKCDASVGSAKPCKGAGEAIVTLKNPIKKTEPTNHSLSKKLGQKASVRPGYSEYSFGTCEVFSLVIRESPTSFIPLPLFTVSTSFYNGPAIPCLRTKIKCTANSPNNAPGNKKT